MRGNSQQAAVKSFNLFFVAGVRAATVHRWQISCLVLGWLMLMSSSCSSEYDVLASTDWLTKCYATLNFAQAENRIQILACKKKWSIFCEPNVYQSNAFTNMVFTHWPTSIVEEKTCFYNRLSNGIRSVFGLCFPTNPMALRVMSVHRVDAPSSSIVTVALEDYAMWEPVNCLETSQSPAWLQSMILQSDYIVSRVAFLFDYVLTYVSWIFYCWLTFKCLRNPGIHYHQAWVW